MSNFFSSILGKVVLYGVLVLLLFVGVNSIYDNVLHMFGFETKADVQAKLVLSQKEVIKLAGVNEELIKELDLKQSSNIATDINLGILFNNYKNWNNTSKGIFDNKKKKPPSNDTTIISTQQIDSIWEMYCSFNVAPDCEGKKK